MKTVAFIFARGGSRGLPGKNLLTLKGKSLVAWAIEQAKAVKRIQRVMVSTDSSKIAEVAKKHGAEVPFLRPAELATDEAPEWLAWRHALEWIKNESGTLPDAMVSVPPTAPLRSPNDIDSALDEFQKGNADAVITVMEAHRNPWFNMVTQGPDGFVRLAGQMGQAIHRRQEAPLVYDMATVAYVLNPLFVLHNETLFSGKVRAVQVPKERGIDIDTAFDLELAEFLMNQKKHTSEIKKQI